MQSKCETKIQDDFKPMSFGAKQKSFQRRNIIMGRERKREKKKALKIERAMKTIALDDNWNTILNIYIYVFY